MTTFKLILEWVESIVFVVAMSIIIATSGTSIFTMFMLAVVSIALFLLGTKQLQYYTRYPSKIPNQNIWINLAAISLFIGLTIYTIAF